jgi:hypothetical protein
MYFMFALSSLAVAAADTASAGPDDDAEVFDNGLLIYDL